MSTLLDNTMKETHNPKSGRFDAIRLARQLVFDANDMARILHRSPSGIRKNPDSPTLQTELSRLVRLVRDLNPLLDGSLVNVRIWLHAPIRSWAIGRRWTFCGMGGSRRSRPSFQ